MWRVQSGLLQTVCEALSRNIIAMNRDSLRQVHQFFVTCDLDPDTRGPLLPPLRPSLPRPCAALLLHLCARALGYERASAATCRCVEKASASTKGRPHATAQPTA